MSVTDAIATTLLRADRARRLLWVASMLGALALVGHPAFAASAPARIKPQAIAQSFRLFVESLWPQAQARGISQEHLRRGVRRRRL